MDSYEGSKRLVDHFVSLVLFFWEADVLPLNYTRPGASILRGYDR